MKDYEGTYTNHKLMPYLPSVVRLDGRSFHNFTKNFDRPFDEQFGKCMVALALYLSKEVRADVAYVQSDEVSLGWFGYEHHPFFDGRIFKINSVLASMASVRFMRTYPNMIDAQKISQIECGFDARVFNLPNETEFHNYFLWREQDATRNSINSVARAYYTHTEVDGKHTASLFEMLYRRGIDWNNYSPYCKRGCYIVKREKTKTIINDGTLPAKHNAYKESGSEFKFRRSEYVVSDRSLWLDKCNIAEL